MVSMSTTHFESRREFCSTKVLTHTIMHPAKSRINHQDPPVPVRWKKNHSVLSSAQVQQSDAPCDCQHQQQRKHRSKWKTSESYGCGTNPTKIEMSCGHQTMSQTYNWLWPFSLLICFLHFKNSRTLEVRGGEGDVLASSLILDTK